MKAVVASILAALGVAASFFWAPAGVALSAAALITGYLALMRLNVAGNRAVFVAAALAHAWTVGHGSGSWLLAAALLPAPLALPPYERVVRALGFKTAWILPVASVLGLAILVVSFARRGDAHIAWWLASLPVMLGSAWVSRSFLASLKRWRGWNRERWEVTVGEEVPDLRLQARRGAPEFSLHAQRGRFVLLQFIRADWCPVCHVIMRIIKREAATLAAHRVKVVVIGPGIGPDADKLVLDLGLEYTVLSDPSHEAAKVFGSFDPTAYGGRGAPTPAAFLVGPDGTLRHSSRSDNVQQFYDPREVIDIIMAEHSAV